MHPDKYSDEVKPGLVAFDDIKDYQYDIFSNNVIDTVVVVNSNMKNTKRHISMFFML